MTTHTEALDNAVGEEDDQFWEPEEDGDRCPFCGSFSPAFTGGCEHHIATIGSDIRITEECSWLRRLSDLYDTATDLIHERSGDRTFERFKKHFRKQSKLAKALIRAADREDRLEDLLVDALGYRCGDGWETGGCLSGSGVNMYHPRLRDSDATEDEAERLYEAFIQGAAEAALAAENPTALA